PLVRLWEACRGRLPEDFDRHIVDGGHEPRTILLRQMRRSKRLVHERVPIGSQMMKPTQWLNLLGRDLEELPDPAYGAWVHRAYTEVMASGRPQLDSVRATTRSLDGDKLRMRYDRLIMPWRASRSDIFVGAVSVRRELTIMP